MKCNHCSIEYRGMKGLTIKDMNIGKIIHHFCSMSCLAMFFKWRPLKSEDPSGVSPSKGNRSRL